MAGQCEGKYCAGAQNIVLNFLSVILFPLLHEYFDSVLNWC